MENDRPPTPPALLRSLMLDAKKGGNNAEKQYVEWHRINNPKQQLKKKYKRQ